MAAASEMTGENGFHVRRLRTAQPRLPVAVAPGTRTVEVALGLAGVADASYAEIVAFG